MVNCFIRYWNARLVFGDAWNLCVKITRSFPLFLVKFSLFRTLKKQINPNDIRLFTEK